MAQIVYPTLAHVAFDTESLHAGAGLGAKDQLLHDRSGKPMITALPKAAQSRPITHMSDLYEFDQTSILVKAILQFQE